MEKHNAKSELESLHDIYRNYLRKTQHLQRLPDGSFPPAERIEWIAAKRAAKFYSRKTGRELKKQKAVLAQMTPAHYKYARTEAATTLIGLRLEFALAIQNAIEVAKTAQSAYAEKEVDIAKENVLNLVAPELAKSNNTDVATTVNPLSHSSSFHSKESPSRTLSGVSPSKSKSDVIIALKLDNENSSADDTAATSSADDIPKVVTDADFDLENLYTNSSANNSKNYTEKDVQEIMQQEDGGNSVSSAREARPTNPSVPSMSNPLRDKARSFHGGSATPSKSVPTVPARQTSGGQLANKIYTAETPVNKSPHTSLNRSMINIRLEEEKEKERDEAVKKLEQEKAHELSSSSGDKGDLTAKEKKGKNPFKSFGKTIGRMFNLHPTASATPASPTATQTAGKPNSPVSPAAKAPVATKPTTPKPATATAAAAASPKGTTFFDLKSSSDEFDSRPQVVVSPKANNGKQNVDHIINSTASFAEIRRIAKTQSKQPIKKTDSGRSLKENSPTVVRAGEITEKTADEEFRETMTNQRAADISRLPVQQPPHQQQIDKQQQQLIAQQALLQKQQEELRHQQALLYAQQKQQRQVQQQQTRPVSSTSSPSILQQQQQPPQQQYQNTEKVPTKGSIEQLRIERDNYEKLMKIADDIISQAKMTENKYNTTPQYWPKVNEAWEECVQYCEREFDRSVDRFKTDWNRKLTYVIKEKHRWNDKMKRLQEYDYINAVTAPTPTSASSQNNSSNNNGVNTSDYRPNSSGSSNRNSTPVNNYSTPIGLSSSSGARSKSMYESSSNGPNYSYQSISPSSSTANNNPAGGPNKLEKLQDKLQRNKVKSILEKAIIVTNSAKYELSKKAINEAKQSWNDAISMYEQSYQNAPEAFKDWWKEELGNVKRQRDEHLATLVEKTPININNTSMYGIDPSNNSSSSSSANPVSNVGGTPNQSSVFSSAADRQDRLLVKKSDLQVGVQFEEPNHSEDFSVVSGLGMDVGQGNNSNNRASVNFHRVRVG